MNDKINQLTDMINESENIVFFGGAGVSTESGIKDFRSADGIYMMNYRVPPETVLSRTFFNEHTAEFYDFYRKYLCYPDSEPNAAHSKLAELEKSGKLKAVITQNVDGLHQKAGSKCVYELHGSALRNYCMKCGKFHGFDFVYNSEGIPKCECGGTVKPDVVLYEEPLNEDIISGAVDAIERAEMEAEMKKNAPAPDIAPMQLTFSPEQMENPYDKPSQKWKGINQKENILRYMMK